MLKIWSLIFFISSASQVSLCDICAICECFDEGGRQNVNCHKRLLSINDTLYTDLFLLENPETLNNLILSDNEIFSLPRDLLKNMRLLRTLDLSRNIIDKIIAEEFAGLNELDVLNLSRNRLEEFDSSLLHVVPNLSFLNLSHNYIKSLTPSTTTASANLTSFDISHNNLRSLDPEFFQLMPELRDLDVSHNTINHLNSSSITHLQHLKVLRLNNNGLLSLNLLDVASTLTELHVGFNMIARIPYELSQIQILNIQHNYVPEITSEIINLALLKCLNISGNSIKDFPDAKLDKLNVLDVSYNDLSEIPASLSVENFPHLETLYLDGNPMRDIRFKRELQLERLSLSNMRQITAIDEFTLSNVETYSNSCINLAISRNTHLSFVSEQAFNHLNICFLDLSNNNIRELSKNLLVHGEKLKMRDGVDLQGNPWHCNCSYQWMLDHLVPQLYQINKKLLDNLKCKTPSLLSSNRMVHWYKWKEQVFCEDSSAFLSNMEVNAEKDPTAAATATVTFGSTNGLLIVLTTSIIVFTVLVIVGIVLSHRIIIRRRQKNRRL